VIDLVILGLGSNIGDSKHNILKAYDQIENDLGPILAKSSFYQSPSWGFKANQDFVNSVIFIQSSHSAEQLLKLIKIIEKNMGRSPKTAEGYESRVIDIDILDFSGVTLERDNLILPHPLMSERAFVLRPLAEILPNWIHPKSGLEIKELTDKLTDLQNIVVLK
jgi:2-amino-4-hydroxy-6-hydroxymethyldihydropteridine diphosphokinase